MQSSFVPIFFHNFSGYDCHLIFELLLTKAFELTLDIKILPKRTLNYVRVQVGCLRFLDSHCFLRSSLDKLVKSINTFPVMQKMVLMMNCLKRNWLILMKT